MGNNSRYIIFIINERCKIIQDILEVDAFLVTRGTTHYS
jgi:hypothetical protein